MSMTRSLFTVVAAVMLFSSPGLSAEAQRIEGGPGFGKAAKAEGDFIFVSETGAVHVYHEAGGKWREAEELKPAEGETEDGFGNALAVDDTTLVVAASQATVNGLNDAGAVYVFERDGEAPRWRQTARLVADEPLENGRFGFSVGVDGQHIAVSGTGLNDEGEEQHRVHIFEREEATLTWSQTASVYEDEIEDALVPIDMSDGMIVAGSEHSFVMTYTYDGTSWNGATYSLPDWHGRDMQLAIESDVLAAGLPYARAIRESEPSGMLVVLERGENTWRNEAGFEASPRMHDGGFARHLDLNDGLIAVTSEHEDANTISLIRKEEDGVWKRFHELDCCYSSGDRSLAISARALVAGNGGPESGSVTIYDTAVLIAPPADDEGQEDDPDGEGDEETSAPGAEGSDNDEGFDDSGNDVAQTDGESNDDDGESSDDDDAGTDSTAGDSQPTAQDSGSGGGAFTWILGLLVLIRLSRLCLKRGQ